MVGGRRGWLHGGGEELGVVLGCSGMMVRTEQVYRQRGLARPNHDVPASEGSSSLIDVDRRRTMSQAEHVCFSELSLLVRQELRFGTFNLHVLVV